MRHFVMLLAALAASSLSACGSSSNDAGTADAGASDAPTQDTSADDGSAGDASIADADGGDAHPGDALDGDAAPTFTEVKQTALSGCSGFGPMQCHTRSPFGGDLDLTDAQAWGQLVGVTSTTDPTVLRVKPGDPDNSMLVRKLTNRLATDGSEGDPMPKGEGVIWSEPPYVQMVRAWIAAGAKND